MCLRCAARTARPERNLSPEVLLFGSRKRLRFFPTHPHEIADTTAPQRRWLTGRRKGISTFQRYGVRTQQVDPSK